MQLWSKCLFSMLMAVFIAGTVLQTIHASAMSVSTAAAAAGATSAAGTMTAKQDISTLAVGSGNTGCLGCASNNDGSMSCAAGCAAQFVALLVAPSPIICQSAKRPDYSRYLAGLWDWRSSPDPYPPRTFIQI